MSKSFDVGSYLKGISERSKGDDLGDLQDQLKNLAKPGEHVEIVQKLEGKTVYSMYGCRVKAISKASFLPEDFVAMPGSAYMIDYRGTQTFIPFVHVRDDETYPGVQPDAVVAMLVDHVETTQRYGKDSDEVIDLLNEVKRLMTK